MSRPFDEAVGRARGHLRSGASEGLEAARALLEAVRLASPDSATATALGEDLQRALEDWIETLRGDGRLALPPALGVPIAQALDREIARWQTRSETEPDARIVLRAFLGLRELLWEIGVRPTDGRGTPRNATASNAQAEPPSPGPRPPDESASTAGPKPRSAPRVQRFDIEH